MIFTDFFHRISFLFHWFYLLYSYFQFYSFLFLSVFFLPIFFRLILLSSFWFLNRNLDGWYEPFPFLNASIRCYKFTSQHCLNCTLYILTHLVFIFILFYVFLNFLETSSLTIEWLQVCLFPCVQKFSCFPSIYLFLFLPYYDRDHTLYDLNLFKFEVHFVAQDMFCLGKWFMDSS